MTDRAKKKLPNNLYINSYIPSAGIMRRGLVLDSATWELMKVYIRKFELTWISL